VLGTPRAQSDVRLRCRQTEGVTAQSAPTSKPGRIGQVIVLNGAPCSGKSTTARAFQALALTQERTWLHVPLDIFDAMLPIGQVPIGDVLTLMHDTNKVISILATGNHVILEVVARENNPAASTALLGVLNAVREHDVLVAYVHCSRETALAREAQRPPRLRGLVERDYGRVDAVAQDVAVDTGLTSAAGAAKAISMALGGTTRVGRDALVKRLRYEARRFEA
jgi:chloramphenicol 3-O phosphotransferase